MDGPTPDQLHLVLRWMKDGPPGAIPLVRAGRPAGCLQAVTWEDAGDFALLADLAGRDGAAFRDRLIHEILPPPDRLLFVVRDASGVVRGHLGLRRFDLAGGTVEACDERLEALAEEAHQAVDRWLADTFGISRKIRPAPPGCAA